MHTRRGSNGGGIAMISLASLRSYLDEVPAKSLSVLTSSTQYTNIYKTVVGFGRGRIGSGFERGGSSDGVRTC